MSFAISSPGTLGGYNNTALGFDMMPTSGRDTHVYFATAQNPRGVVNQEQYLNKVMSNPTPPKEEGISKGMKAHSAKLGSVGQSKTMMSCTSIILTFQGASFWRCRSMMVSANSLRASLSSNSLKRCISSQNSIFSSLCSLFANANIAFWPAPLAMTPLKSSSGGGAVAGVAAV